MRGSAMGLREFGRGMAIQYFSYGPFEFNVNRAMVLAANRKKYRPKLEAPQQDWVGPNIDIDESQISRADLRRPVLFATLIKDGAPWRVLIDGNHRVLRAARSGKKVPVIILDFPDTLRILSGPEDMIDEMKAEAGELGL